MSATPEIGMLFVKGFDPTVLGAVTSEEDGIVSGNEHTVVPGVGGLGIQGTFRGACGADSLGVFLDEIRARLEHALFILTLF